MDLSNLKVFSMANRNMQYLSAKQRVIAANIANASTPDYVPQDVEKPAFLQFESNSHANLKLHVTNEKHFPNVLSEQASLTGGGFKVYRPQLKDALTIDGNGVVLEDQMNEASKASAEYKKMITIYNSYKNMLKVANTKING